jgi:PiT family inorganic phosphate transporter
MPKSPLDKDLKKQAGLDTAAHQFSRSFAGPGISAVFLCLAAIWASFVVAGGPLTWLVIIAAALAAYMALNVGANDVANNMGPAVGARVINLTGALILAAIFEAAGALIAGGDVVNTVARDLIDGSAITDTETFIILMMSALLASALWVNLATIIGAPVSTTHAVVGGVVGAGIASAGFGVVSWGVIGMIVLSWIISPVLGGLIAALFLQLVRTTITQQKDKVTAARVWLPVLVAIMAGAFAMYLSTKGLSRVWDPELWQVALLGIVAAVLAWLVAVPWVKRRSIGMENRNKQVAHLFRLPLLCAAALLCFAHGANDVANAVGPFAAIVQAAQTGSPSAAGITLPYWVLAIGAVGLALGLGLFGPRVIRTVGEKITKMNEIRAYCVALSAAITVLAASALGMPVSSTHIAVGAVFGVGFLREYISFRELRGTVVPVRAKFIDPALLNEAPEAALSRAKTRERRRLVRRQHVIQIGAAWVVTVPAAALLSALVYFGLAAIVG